MYSPFSRQCTVFTLAGDFNLKVTTGSVNFIIATLTSPYQIVQNNTVHNYRHSERAYV